ncbi:MAG: hypothetical protein RLZ62_2612 [Bacteroidota bacterium]
MRPTVHRMRKILFTVTAAVLSFTASAQMERTTYQTFEVDSARIINLDIMGEYEIKTWAGSNLLVETNIQIWDANKEILNFLIREGRYDLATDSTADPHPREIRIYTRYTERKPVKKKDGGKCLEIAVTRIFIPDTYVISEDKRRLTRKKP